MRFIIGVLLISGSLTANAALLGRAPVDDPMSYGEDPIPESDFQAWYDTRLNITWLDDATYAATSDDIPLPENGERMTWHEAQTWLAALNATNHLGANNWRLPTALPVDEMHDLFSATLGNHGAFDAIDPCVGVCLANTGPFENILPSDYWTGTLQFNGDWAADFYWGGGYAGNGDVVTSRKHVWAVHDGDPLAVVPAPPAIWLLGSALSVMGWKRRKNPT